MSKSSIFAVFLSFVSASLFAQNPSSYYVEDPRTFYAGLIVGGNFSQVDGDSYAGYHKVGLNAGGIVYVHMAPNLAASLEILYSQKGSRGHKPLEGTGSVFIINKYRIELNYAELPLMLNYFDKRRSHFGGGVSYGQLITSDEVAETVPLDPNRANFANYKFKKSDINFVLGGNLHLWKGLFLNARFHYSLVSIRNDIPPGFGNRNSQFNNTWAVRLMYLF
jgi:hypothetical protein